MRSTISLLTVAILLMQAAASYAGHGMGHVTCPECDYICQVSIAKVKEEKTCYEVDCKPICIPRVTFPWEHFGKGGGGKGKACGHGSAGECVTSGCAKVKVVKVLRKETYECTKCKCTWTAVPVKGHGCSKDALGKDGVSPHADDVPEPPPVEAAVPRPRSVLQPVGFDTEINATPVETEKPKRSFREIFRGLFE